MKILVTYKSRTGFTKKYAEIIASKIDCTLIDFKDITAKKMAEFDTVVYGARLHAGTIDNFKKAYELFSKSGAKHFAVFVTGGTPNDAKEIIDKVWNDNLNTIELKKIPHFYMQSGVCYEKMNLPDKALMKFAAKMMSITKDEDKDEHEKGFENAITASYDVMSEEYTEPLVEYLKNIE